MWHYVFDEFGGYDEQSAGYLVFENKNYIFTVDVMNFTSIGAGEEELHQPNERANDYARRVVNALNNVERV